MDSSFNKRLKARKRRVMRVRKKLRGNKDKPRMCINKTSNHIFVQLINDDEGKTLASYGTMSKEMKNIKTRKESAVLIGKKIAELAKEQKIERVVLDRGRFKYHGIIAELATAARNSGIKF